MIKNMKYHVAILPVVLIAAFAVPNQGVAARDLVMADSVASVGTNGQRLQFALKNDVPPQPQTVVPSQSASSTVFRDLPSING